jgi:hypothetical protein
MWRALAVLVVAVVLVAGTLSWRERGRIARMDDAVAARRELAATRLAPDGAAPRAGVSARAPIRVRPLPDRLARRLHGDADFQRLSHRCGVCHTTPDPSLYTGAQWPGVLDRMAGTIDAAGLLPLSAADREAVLRVLSRHAADTRASR